MKQATKDKKRLDKLKEILTTLESGNVQNRTLKTWLTADEFAGFESGWEEQKELRELYKCKPDEIKEYEARLKQALFFYNRYDDYGRKGNTVMVRKFEGLHATAFEGLLEYLDEILSADISLMIWFDRPIDMRAVGDCSLCPIGMPRIVTSRSLDSLSGIAGLLSKNEFKRKCVGSAIDILLNPITEVDKEMLEEKLRQLRVN